MYMTNFNNYRTKLQSEIIQHYNFSFSLCNILNLGSDNYVINSNNNNNKV